MKPTKNRYYCFGCGKSKMLFSTKQKADNFIKFNSNEILHLNGFAPIRSYYCQHCGGWHVTSRRYFSDSPNETFENYSEVKVYDQLDKFLKNSQAENIHLCRYSSHYMFGKDNDAIAHDESQIGVILQYVNERLISICQMYNDGKISLCGMEIPKLRRLMDIAEKSPGKRKQKREIRKEICHLEKLLQIESQKIA